jgi:hypothetical protein
MNNDLLKLKTSLCDAINKWMNDQAEVDEEWNQLDTYISDNAAELMTDSAFNILLAQSDLTKHLRKEDIISQ